MRADLLDAHASVKWAIAQIDALQERFLTWMRSYPYELRLEPDPDSFDKLLVAREKIPLDPLINVEAGMIINANRSALDMVAVALSRRNGIEPDRYTKFPIHELESGLTGELNNIKQKNWLSDSEIAKIKSLKPYKGGDALLYPLHYLDIVRKHERLIRVNPEISNARTTIMLYHARQEWRRLPDKTILARCPGNTPDFSFSQHNSNITSQITLNEPSIGLVDESAVLKLKAFCSRCYDIVTKEFV